MKILYMRDVARVVNESNLGFEAKSPEQDRLEIRIKEGNSEFMKTF